MIHIVTDSVASLPKEWLATHGVTSVPLSYTFEGVTKREGFPGEFDDFFKSFRGSRALATTSQPSPADFRDVFDRLTADGDSVIAVTISKEMSGTWNSAMLAKEESASDRIRVIDSAFAAAPQAFLVEQAVQMAKHGLSLDAAEEMLLHLRDTLSLLILPQTLEYLRRGGRLSRSQAVIGELLHIRPLLHVVDGSIVVREKIRGASRALAAMVDAVPAEAKWIRVLHVVSQEAGDQLVEKLKQKHPHADVSMGEIGPVVGIHVGPGTVGVAFSTETPFRP